MFFNRVRPLRRDLMQLTLLGLIPLAVMAALAIFNAARAHRAELSRSTLDLSRAVASAVQAELDAAVITLVGLTQSPDLQSGNIRSFYGTAVNTVGLQQSWIGLTLSDGTGRTLFRTTRPFGDVPRQEAVEPESLVRVLRTGRPVVGALTRGEGGRVAVPVRVPLVREGRVEYVVSAIMSPSRLLNMLAHQRTPPDWVIAVLDSDLQIVARSKAQQGFVGRTATPALQGLVLAGQDDGSGVSTSQEGHEVVTGFSRTRAFNWVVAVGAPTAPLAGLFSPTVALYLAGVGTSLAICVLLAMGLGRRIAGEIGEMVEAAARLGDGMAAPAVRSRTAEIERLGSALREAGTRLHTSEAALRRALQDAQAAGRAKDEFMAVLGHELRNPLAPMLSAMYLLDARLGEASARERAILRRQMAHLHRLVDDLLDVSRIARGKVEIRTAPVDVVQVLREVIDDLRQASAPGAAGISLHGDLGPAVVLGDAARLAQVFTNLLTNSLRYGEGRPVAVTVARQSSNVRIRVQDQGEGMDEATLARIFEPFFQAPQSLSRPKGGLGLGLAIVRAIVEAHGGRVTASSAGRGHGSRFEAVLPLLPPGQPLPD